MCLRCEGWLEDEVDALYDDRIRTHGWTTVSVADRPGDPTWTYTVGLAFHGHPELLVASMAHDAAAGVLDEPAERVVDGERFDAVDDVTYRGAVAAQLRDVHPVHVERGIVGSAQSYYAWAGRSVVDLRVRQVVIPDDEFCSCHAGRQPPLHMAHTLFGTAGPRRAERRRTARQARRASRGRGAR